MLDAYNTLFFLAMEAETRQKFHNHMDVRRNIRFFTIFQKSSLSLLTADLNDDCFYQLLLLEKKFMDCTILIHELGSFIRECEESPIIGVNSNLIYAKLSDEEKHHLNADNDSAYAEVFE